MDYSPWDLKELDMTEQLTLSQDKNTIGGRGTLRKQKEGKPEARDAGTNCWTARLQTRTCLSGSGASMAILITLTTLERLTLLVSKRSPLVLCPGPVIIWTSSLLSCG